MRYPMMLIAFLLIADPVGAAPDLGFYQSRAVRIEVRGSTPRDVASSGFLWQRNDRVVTSLHAIPLDGNILVKCGNDVRRARLEKMLPDEDLALLQVLPSRSGVAGLPNCLPFDESDLGADPGYQRALPLYAYGWHGDAATGQPITMYRAIGGQLQSLVPSNVARAIHEYGIPSITREIYAMRNGSLPGYSGGLVIDGNRRLIAIVDGGLNDGAAGFTWAIPSAYLRLFAGPDAFDASGRTRRPAVPQWLYSMALPDPPSDSVIEYREIDALTDTPFDYRWFHTKTLSLAELARSAADPDGLLTIYNAYGRRLDPNRLVYDIYEDLDYGLIIAVPENQPLVREQVSGNPGYYWLKSEPASRASHTQYRQTLWSVSSPTFPRAEVHPGDPAFFRYKLGELLAECNRPGSTYCDIDPQSLRVVTFPGGNKILRVGFGVRSRQHDGVDYYFQDYYDYYSIAVRDGVAFRAFLRFFGDRRGGPRPCQGGQGRICPNPTPEQLAQMIAVQLTTFANLGTSSGRSPEAGFKFEGRAWNPETLGTGYFEGRKLRFYNSRGKIWLHYFEDGSDSTNEYVEYSRDERFAYLTSEGYERDIANDSSFFAVPLRGGQYHHRSSPRQPWQPVGGLQPLR